MSKNILFLGCGKMGSVVLKNMIEEKALNIDQVQILKRSDKDKISKIKYSKSISSLESSDYKADIVFICIKPQNCETTLKELIGSKIVKKSTIFVSILAGKKLEFFTKIFGKDSRIVRSMPNLPIEYSQGILPYITKNLTKSDKTLVAKLFKNFGLSFEVKNEKSFDSLTALFGSGPAYIFLLQEIFSKIAKEYKIDKELIPELVKTLFLGSAMMSYTSDYDFSSLKKSVTSKKGTTEAALNVLEENSALEKILKKAIDAAYKKSDQLSKD